MHIVLLILFKNLRKKIEESSSVFVGAKSMEVILLWIAHEIMEAQEILDPWLDTDWRLITYFECGYLR